MEPLAPVAEFALDPDLVHMNHGSFGAAPRAVLTEADRWRALIEADATSFFLRRWREAAEPAEQAAAQLLGMDPADMMPLQNATHATATVLSSIDWSPGDRLVLTDHAYPAVNAQADALRRRKGVDIVVIPVEPVAALCTRIADALNARTRLIVLDQITAPSALVLPVAEVAALARGSGARVCVDAAHVPGQIEVDVPALGVDYWSGNLHKWAAAPRVCAVLWRTPELAESLEPLAPSSAYSVWPSTQARFAWSGTHDPSPWLCVPTALAWLSALPGGREGLRRHAEGILTLADLAIAAALDTPPPSAVDRAPCMRAWRLPAPMTAGQRAALTEALAARGVLALCFEASGATYLRLSAYAYSSSRDVDRFADALPHALRAARHA